MRPVRLGDVVVAVVAEEWPVSQVPVELGSVCGFAGANLVEGLHRQALGVVVVADHQRRDGGDQHQLGDSFSAVAPEVVDDFAASGGVAHQRDVAQIESGDPRVVIRVARSSA
jgi:hypothetical protein